MRGTFAGSVNIILRPGFFFGFESASSDPESMAEFADSTMNKDFIYQTHLFA
jgi:hypothetical protein